MTDIELYDHTRRHVQRVREKARKNDCALWITPKEGVYLLYDRLDDTLQLVTIDEADTYVSNLE